MPIQILPGRVCFYISWWDANVPSEGNCWDSELAELVFYLPEEMVLLEHLDVSIYRV